METTDKDKMKHFATVIDTVVFPIVKGKKENEILGNVKILLQKTSKYLREQTEKIN